MESTRSLGPRNALFEGRVQRFSWDRVGRPCYCCLYAVEAIEAIDNKGMTRTASVLKRVTCLWTKECREGGCSNQQATTTR